MDCLSDNGITTFRGDVAMVDAGRKFEASLGSSVEETMVSVMKSGNDA